MARLVHNRTGSVVVVPDEKANGLLLGFGYSEESEAPKKAPAKKTAAKKAPAKADESSKSEQ